MPNIKMTVKVPDLSVFAGQIFVDRIAAAQRKLTAPDLKELFHRTVRGWTNPPNFVQKQEIRPYSISMTVYADGENADQYALVVKGSPPHRIVPKKATWLRFQKGYTRSTYPRLLSSRQNSRFGEYVQAEGVNHPGFEPRAFDEAIADDYFQTFAKDMQEAMDLTKPGF